jgi:5-methylcytosine-specific restriction endonuclease McrA
MTTTENDLTSFIRLDEHFDLGMVRRHIINEERRRFRKSARSIDKHSRGRARSNRMEAELLWPLIEEMFERAMINGCYYCGEHFDARHPFERGARMTIDHKVPISRGGGHVADNIVVACRKCNGVREWMGALVLLDPCVDERNPLRK